MTRSIKGLLIGLALAGIATGAAAAQPRQVVVNKVVVRYPDLNLQNEAGAATLLGRLSRAAHKVCNDATASPAYIRPRYEGFACRQTAMQNAVAKVDHPVVTAMYQSTRNVAPVKLAS